MPIVQYVWEGEHGTEELFKISQHPYSEKNKSEKGQKEAKQKLGCPKTFIWNCREFY